MYRKITLSIVSLMCLFSSSVFAVGLGEIKYTSGLNQPLNAEIPLLSAGDLAEYEVHATLASARVFEKYGVDRVFFLNSIKFKIDRDSNDQIIIRVSTLQAVKEPFLNFIVELNWPNGQVSREYTLLLDPPVFEDNTASTIEKTTSKPPERQVTRQQNNQAESSTPPSRYQPRENTSANYTGSSYGPVSSNDTLWSIASKTRPDNSVSIHQTLVAIYRANPDAFSNGNINNLLKGKVLEIPDAETIRNVPQRAALQDVVMQNRQWRSGGARKIVDRSGTNDASSDSVSGGSRLRLGTENTQGDAQGYGADTAELNKMRSDLARSEEEAATLQAENEALRSRLADILSKAEGTTEESAIEVEDAELAALGQTSESQNDNETAAMDSEDTGGEVTDSEISQDNQASELTDSTTNPDSIESGAETNDETVGTDAASDEQAQTAEAKIDTPPSIFKPEKKSFIDEMMESTAVFWGGIAAIVLIILMLVFWRMKKRMEDDEFQDDLVASAGAGSMDTTETFELPDVGDDMLVELDMDDDEQVVNPSKDESFDPLGEADIYIAYGKHEQAENLLLDAIEENPVRADLKVKLMECYAESDDQEKFESLATEVAEAIDADEWGEQINGLRAQAWGGEQAPEISDDDDFDLPSTEDIFGEDDDQLDVNFDDIDDEVSLEDNNATDSEEDFLAEGETETLEDLDDIELDGLDEDELDSLEDFEELNLDEDDDTSGDQDELLELDEDEFSIGLDDGDEISLDDNDGELSSSADEADEISLDIDDDFSFDEDDDADMDFDENIGEEGDEIATKLDLARAYVDMGDADGAKEILKEVVAEGNDQQKQEAQELIDKAD